MEYYKVAMKTVRKVLVCCQEAVGHFRPLHGELKKDLVRGSS